MNKIKKFFSTLSRKNKSFEDSSEQFLSALVKNNSIDKQKALEIPSVKASINYITKQIASIPLALYRMNSDTVTKISEDEDNRVKLLNGDTGDLLDRFQMLSEFIADYLLFGNGFIYKNQELNKTHSLHYVDCKRISNTSNIDPIFKDCIYLINGKQYESYQFIKIMQNSKDGAKGKGIIDENTQLLDIAYSLMLYTGKMVKNGGNKKGFLKSSKTLSQSAIDKLKEAWRKFYGSDSEESIIILNEGLEFKESSNTSVELQLNESRKTVDNNIYSIFGLSEEIVNGTAKNDAITSVFKTTLFPIMSAIETALDKSFLLEKEKTNCYWAFDTTEILKDDIEKRFKAYEIALANDFMQIDEVRRIENMSPLGLNFIKLGLNDVLYNLETGEMYTPNTNQRVNLENPKGSGKVE